MTSIVTDFKSIKRILDRQEQKAEFEAKNPVASLLQIQAEALAERLVRAYQCSGGGGLADWLNKTKI